jgi:hypothetical protein
MVKIRFLSHLLVVALLPWTCYGGWRWSDLIVGGGTSKGASTNTADTTTAALPATWLTMSDVSQMRARDIKRRLSRQHGYGADELSRILDKKELIRTLAFEEYKIQQAHEKNVRSALWTRAILISVLAVAVVYCWPLLSHLWEVAWVNLVVYYDKKVYEAKRCHELSSVLGFVGVIVMLVLDVLQVWLTASVVLSWVMTSAYFFPVPSISIRPAQLMGGAAATGPLSGYGINIGPMVITWTLRLAQGRVEHWTGRALLQAMQRRKQQERVQETPEERDARKAERRARRAARQQQEEAASAEQQQYRARQPQPHQNPYQQQQQQYNRAPESFSPSSHALWPITDDDEPPIWDYGTEDRDDFRTESASPPNNENGTRTPWDDLD